MKATANIMAMMPTTKTKRATMISTTTVTSHNMGVKDSMMNRKSLTQCSHVLN